MSWRTIRQRLAPSASRTPSSRWRVIALASRRLVTLTQASSSTRPTTLMTIAITNAKRDASAALVGLVMAMK